MRKIKTAGIIFLLLIITGCVVFLPWFISRQNKENMLSKTVSWHYNAQNRAGMTNKQIAFLYYKGDCNVNCVNRYSPSQANLEKAFEIIFASDTSLCEQMKAMLCDDRVCASDSVLTMVDNRPYVLNFVRIFLSSDDYKLNLVYEEKTKTLVNFSYSSYYYDGVEDERVEWLNRMQSVFEAYYQDWMEIDSEMFYSYYEIFDGIIIVSAGIKQGEWFEEGYSEKIENETGIYDWDTKY